MQGQLRQLLTAGVGIRRKAVDLNFINSTITKAYKKLPLLESWRQSFH